MLLILWNPSTVDPSESFDFSLPRTNKLFFFFFFFFFFDIPKLVVSSGSKDYK